MGTFGISMPDELTEKLDEVARREHRSRSAQVILIIEDWLEKQEKKK